MKAQSALMTMLILDGSVKPLTVAIGRSDGLAIGSANVMTASTLLALFFSIISLIDVRRARAAKAALEV